jgi:two-component SAPR family response regulator
MFSHGRSLISSCRHKRGTTILEKNLIVDDDADVTITFKAGIKYGNNNADPNKRIEVCTSNDPVTALNEFKPNFYDLLLVDIKMPHMNGFELCEKILVIDINVRICFMSAVEINREGLREIYPSLGLGCFIRKPVTMDYLVITPDLSDSSGHY